jgi:antitoxin ChpS
MATAKLRKVGGSTMVAIPPGMLDTLNLSASNSVDLSLESGALVVRPARKRYTLDSLLAECKPVRRRSGEEQAWLDAPRVGREI